MGDVEFRVTLTILGSHCLKTYQCQGKEGSTSTDQYGANGVAHVNILSCCWLSWYKAVGSM